MAAVGAAERSFTDWYLSDVMRLSCTSAAQQSSPCLLTQLHHFTTAISHKAQAAANRASPNKPLLSFPARREEAHSSHRQRKTSCRAAVNLPAPDLTEKKPRLAIFVSGGGSNFRAIHAGILDGRINAEVAVSGHPSGCWRCG